MYFIRVSAIISGVICIVLLLFFTLGIIANNLVPPLTEEEYTKYMDRKRIRQMKRTLARGKNRKHNRIFDKIK